MAKKRKVSEDSFETEPEQNDSNSNSNSDSNSQEKNEEEKLDIAKILEPFTKEQLIELLKTAVTTNPKLIDQINLIADSDPTQRKLFIHGLGWETSSEKLGEYFSQYGEIEDCNVVTDKITGKSKGYGFICFKTRKDAEKALKEPQKKIESRMTACQLASAGPVMTNLQQQQPVQNALNNEAVCRKIYVGNVHSDIPSDKLLAFFAQFGEIEEGPLGVDKMTGKFKGFALFIYKTVEGAKKALEEQTKNFEGHQLVCQRATDNHKQKGSAGSVTSKTPSIGPGGGYNVPGVVGYTAPNAVMASQGLAVNPAFYGQGLIGGPQQFGQGVVPIQAALAVLAAAGQNPAAFGVPQVMPGYGMVNAGYQNPKAHQANPYQSGPVGQGSAPRPNSAMGPKGGGYRGR